MANLTFNFNKIPHTYFNVTLKDGTVLQVRMPTKNTFEKVQHMNELMQQDAASVDDVIDTVAGVMADCLSNNMNKVTITGEQVAAEYDIEEMIAFIQNYYDKFVGSIQSNPN